MTRLKRAAGDGRLARNSSLTILVSDQVPRLNRFSVTEHIRKLVVRRVTKCPQSQDYGKLVLDASSTFAGMRLDSWRQGNRSTNPPIFRTEGNVDILPASGGDVYPPNEESILSTGSVLSIAAGAVTGAAIGMATGCGAAGIAPLVAAGVVTAGVLYWVPWRKWFGKKEASEPGDEHGKEEHEKRPTPPANPAETTGPTTGDNIKTFLTSTVISGIVSYGASYMVMLVIAKGGAAYLTYFAWIAGPLALAYAIYVTPWNKIFTWMQTKYRIRESSVRRFFGMANASHGRNCL
ncbi:hypothetical protein SEUCBS139899_004547 [Sporothrix eucalyptigena]|uniref:Uncharacterized protein n=1 Tax=Sporothrix eucalyptigena TaxID=1812306 RepID=A0ABP0BG46_9PEZI